MLHALQAAAAPPRPAAPFAVPAQEQWVNSTYVPTATVFACEARVRAHRAPTKGLLLAGRIATSRFVPVVTESQVVGHAAEPALNMQRCCVMTLRRGDGGATFYVRFQDGRKLDVEASNIEVLIRSEAGNMPGRFNYSVQHWVDFSVLEMAQCTVRIVGDRPLAPPSLLALDDEVVQLHGFDAATGMVFVRHTSMLGRAPRAVGYGLLSISKGSQRRRTSAVANVSPLVGVVAEARQRAVEMADRHRAPCILDDVQARDAEQHALLTHRSSQVVALGASGAGKTFMALARGTLHRSCALSRSRRAGPDQRRSHMGPARGTQGTRPFGERERWATTARCWCPHTPGATPSASRTS